MTKPKKGEGKKNYLSTAEMKGIKVEVYKEKPTGWICPRCNKVHSPYINYCNCDYDN